jgi:MvaI/BcnI restriction endonuclease family protein
LKKRKNTWTEIEICDAVKAYFALLKNQQKFELTNKAAIYRELHAAHPMRSAKSFEFKFQNISAVLYEEKLPYADGLKPMGNYQTALKISVLAYLKHEGQKKQTPIKILIDKLKRLRGRSFLPIRGTGSGRYGLTLEHYLSIPQNSSKAADFMGIELKTKHDKSLQTLFSRVPSRYLVCKDKKQLVEKFGYLDKARERRSLYTSFNNTLDSLGFHLAVGKDTLVVNKEKIEILEYDNSLLEDALLTKHNETAYVSVSSKRLKNGSFGCRFDKLLYCKTPSLLRFLHMAEDGNVYLNFTLSEKSGRVKDHGFLWRVPQKSIGDLYQKTKLIDLVV